MSMPGGGCHKVAPGQVTDDGELTMGLLHGLVAGNGKLNLQQICRYYGEWTGSAPFDVGGTTRNGLFKCSTSNPNPARVHLAASKGPGATSLSNGAMMRISPLAVWCQRLASASDIERAVGLEVTFTHA